MVIEFQQRFSPDCLRLPCEKHPLGIGEPEPPAAEPLFGQLILGLKELNDDQLLSMNPAGHDHQ